MLTAPAGEDPEVPDGRSRQGLLGGDPRSEQGDDPNLVQGDRPDEIAAVETPIVPRSRIHPCRDGSSPRSIGWGEIVARWHDGPEPRYGGPISALEHPVTPDYSDRYGVPTANLERQDFIESATLVSGTPFVTREAPGVESSRGGGIEVVVSSGVQGHSFSIVDRGGRND